MKIGILALVALVFIAAGIILYGAADLRFGGYVALAGMGLALVAIGLARWRLRKLGKDDPSRPSDEARE